MSVSMTVNRAYQFSPDTDPERRYRDHSGYPFGTGRGNGLLSLEATTISGRGAVPYGTLDGGGFGCNTSSGVVVAQPICYDTRKLPRSGTGETVQFLDDPLFIVACNQRLLANLCCTEP